MCGLVGWVKTDGYTPDRKSLSEASNCVQHRGPDDHDLNITQNVGLAHRRLSILDLSKRGRQPMTDSSSGLSIIYNGEIYNYRMLRKNLQERGYEFISDTDTEILLKGWDQWQEDLLSRINGMYAFVIYNPKTRRLIGCRDEFGMKPLYVYRDSGQLILASEQKSILSLTDNHPAMDPEGLNEYLAFQNFLSNRTFLKKIRTLPPGVVKKWSVESLDIKSEHNFTQLYFDGSYDGTREQAIKELQTKLRGAVQSHMVSDVPVHAYLSGGMDSSTIAAIASKHSNEPLKTFTVGFEGAEDCDEREPARIVADEINSDHYEDAVTPETLEDVMSNLIWHLEEPRAGQSYPNLKAAQLASQHGKVVLSGTGGDELFGGYPWRYQMTWGAGNHKVNRKRMYRYWERLYNDEQREQIIDSTLHSEITFNRPKQLFHNWLDSMSYDLSKQNEFLNAFFHIETKLFLKGLFHVEDKLGMGVGIEARFPFMDKKLVNLATSLPPQWKVNPFNESQNFGEHRKLDNGKIILRDAMKKILPEKISARKKQGFSGPYSRWQHNEQQEFIQRIISNNPYFKLGNNPTISHDVLQGWGLLSTSVFVKQFLR